MPGYFDAFEIAVGTFVDSIRAQVGDDDAQILERWNRVVSLDILKVVARFRQDEAEKFDRWVNGYDNCTSCGKEMRRLDMYAYESRELEKVRYSHHLGRNERNASGACYDCQRSFLDRHTSICECGLSFFRGNRLQVRCPICQEKESLIVRHNTRARKLGLDGSLRQIEWAETLEHFDGSCAYCGGSFDIVEHFTPLSRGGGTNAWNCVPACAHCNIVKKDLDGRADKDILAARLNIHVSQLDRIEEYLEARHN